jgi:hypothetical protein
MIITLHPIIWPPNHQNINHFKCEIKKNDYYFFYLFFFLKKTTKQTPSNKKIPT